MAARRGPFNKPAHACVLVGVARFCGSSYITWLWLHCDAGIDTVHFHTYTVDQQNNDNERELRPKCISYLLFLRADLQCKHFLNCKILRSPVAVPLQFCFLRACSSLNVTKGLGKVANNLYSPDLVHSIPSRLPDRVTSLWPYSLCCQHLWSRDQLPPR